MQASELTSGTKITFSGMVWTVDEVKLGIENPPIHGLTVRLTISRADPGAMIYWASSQAMGHEGKFQPRIEKTIYAQPIDTFKTVGEVSRDGEK